MLTDRQLDMMNVLWEKGSATVREAKELLDDGAAYTSVLTVFQTLEENGYVRHEPEGKAYRYYPVMKREEAANEYLRFLERQGLLRDVVKQGREVVDREEAPV